MTPIYRMANVMSNELIVERKIYQRRSHQDKIDKIVAHWDERIANEPKVSLRDGKYYVFDGQHTILAREVLNNSQPLEIMCKIYENLSIQDEAHLFAKQTGTSSKPRACERLRANVFAEEDEATSFCKATERAGIIVDMTGVRHKNRLGCVSTALKAYRNLGEDRYYKAMEIIAKAWKGNPDSLRFEIVKAVTEFVELFGNDYKQDMLIKKLENVDPMIIRDRINSDTETPSNKKYAYQIWRVYHGRSNAA